MFNKYNCEYSDTEIQKLNDEWAARAESIGPESHEEEYKWFCDEVARR